MTNQSLMYRGAKGVATLEKELEELEAAATEQEAKEDTKEAEQEEAPKSEEALSPEEKSFKKRYGDLRRHSQARENELKARIDELEKKFQNAATNGTLPKTKEEVEAWVKKYPDIARIVRGLAQEQVKASESQLDTRLKKVEELEAAIALEKAEAALSKLHPDFNEIRDTQEFHDWAEEQPKWIQNALYEDSDVAAAARAIDLYKLDKGIKKAPADRNAAMSVSARSRVTPQEDEKSSWWKESQVNRMSDKEYEAKAPEIEKAIREGKFIYDLSKKAR